MRCGKWEVWEVGGGGSESVEVERHHVQGRLISYEHVNKDSCLHFTVHFSDGFVPVRFQELIFVELRRHFIYCILLRGTLVHSAA